jgi:hypothetical protein
MPTFIESGLRLDLPDETSFRFADTEAYNAVKGLSLKEMDFAWVDAGKLFVLEVRSYARVTETLSPTDFIPVKGQAEPYRFSALVDKITDSLLMLLSAWAGTAWGRKLKAELPKAARARMPVKLVVAVELPPGLIVHLQALRDSLNARLKGRVALADVKSVALIDYGRLISEPTFNGFVRRAPEQAD